MKKAAGKSHLSTDAAPNKVEPVAAKPRSLFSFVALNALALGGFFLVASLFIKFEMAHLTRVNEECIAVGERLNAL